jgi:hypothetical protein
MLMNGKYVREMVDVAFSFCSFRTRMASLSQAWGRRILIDRATPGDREMNPNFSSDFII